MHKRTVYLILAVIFIFQLVPPETARKFGTESEAAVSAEETLPSYKASDSFYQSFEQKAPQSGVDVAVLQT